MDSVPVPPRLDEVNRQPVNRGGWAVHLALMTLYIFALLVIGLERNRVVQPALSHSVKGLLMVCGVELGMFGLVFGLACLASRPTAEDLLLRWRGKAQPVWLGAAYSVGLRLLVGFGALFAAGVLVLTKVVSFQHLQDFAMEKRPQVEKMVDVSALRDNPVYYLMALTVVSFVLAGLREELWRVSVLAGLRRVWPGQFGSKAGQLAAVGVVAVIFGLAHWTMGPLAAVMAGLLGVGLGCIMVFHGSIWPAVFAHGFFDCTSIALLPYAFELLRQLPKPH